MQPLESELAPESILPAKLFDRPFGGARVQPEKRQVAVLADAVLTFHRWAGQRGCRELGVSSRKSRPCSPPMKQTAPSRSWPSATRSSSTPSISVGAFETGARIWKPRSNQSDPFVVTAMGRGIRWCSHGSGESLRAAMRSETDHRRGAAPWSESISLLTCIRAHLRVASHRQGESKP